MARFIASIQGQRGHASRLGSEKSGISGHVRGWNIGGAVSLKANGEDDTVTLRLSSGSNNVGYLGVEIEATSGDPQQTPFIVRLPGGFFVRGYAGADALCAVAGCNEYVNYHLHRPATECAGCSNHSDHHHYQPWSVERTEVWP